MDITKELNQIAWDVSEDTYRKDPALSYSTLAKYEREGFNRLDKLFESISTPSLTHGSMVDAILTGGMDEFNERFQVLDVSLTEGGMNTVKALLADNLPYTSFEDIPASLVSQYAKEAGFWKADKWDNVRYREVLKTGNIAEYYNASRDSSKTIVGLHEYQEAMACVNALRESEATASYFAQNDPFSPIRRYYQLKFKAKFGNVDYRCMADLIVVDYEHKVIYPVDLKTSSHTEWDFQESFMQWKYLIQAMLYWRIIRLNLDNDPYFKDFKLHNYRFIVVNKYTLTPLVWEYPLTKEHGTLIDKEGNEYRDPFDIGNELKSYLSFRPKVPKGIKETGINEITCLKLKKE